MKNKVLLIDERSIATPDSNQVVITKDRCGVDARRSTRRIGVIDIGTNSVKLLVASVNGGMPRVLRERVVITRLGEGLTGRGRLGSRAMERTVRAVEGLAGEARRLGVDRPCTVGTAALRVAGNRAEFRRRLRRQTGLWLEVLSGAREAELSFRAATHGLPADGRVAVVDVGGGSTEIAWKAGRAHRCLSLPLGAVGLTERLLGADPIRAAEFRRLSATIRRVLARGLGRAVALPRRVVAVGGTASTLAAMQRGLRRPVPERIHGSRMSRSQIRVWIVVLSLLPIRKRVDLPGLEPGRADIIVAGAAILAGVLAAIGASDMIVSARGLRYGVLLEQGGA
jgi:exopolyphosphatase/guanosine-5'-triphosphate,3'-diphosphate pyrophosphatase